MGAAPRVGWSIVGLLLLDLGLMASPALIASADMMR
jgi:hypothetical protein